MESNQLKKGQVYQLQTTHSDDANYFVVMTDDKKFKVKKLKFQIGQTVPDKISCLVKSTRDDNPIIVLDLTPYINEFYHAGQEYEFKVRADFSRNNFYEVEDDKGMYFRLPSNGINLGVGQTVTCKVVNINGSSVKLTLSSLPAQVNELPFWDMATLREKFYNNDKVPAWVFEVLTEDEKNLLIIQYNHKDPRWVINAANLIIDKIPSWFGEEQGVGYDTVAQRLRDITHATRTLLEGSDFLLPCNAGERQHWREELSRMTSHVNHFKRACCMLKDGDYHQFIDGMFSNLKFSGYLYHPDKQFHTFNAMLRIHPMFIHQAMGQIFDALTAWPIDNWKMEPFRSAFVRQTELYIRENQHIVDEIVDIKNKDNNDMVNKMIMALAIQMLIVDETHDHVDAHRNRAMFYRYCSYVNNVQQGVLLDKSLASIMGVNLRPEFTWNHLRQPVMLTTLSGVDNSSRIPENTLKTYSHLNCTLEVSADGIVVRSGSPDNSTTALSNSLSLWQGLQVYVDSKSKLNKLRPNEVKNLAKNKRLWEEIDSILFAVNEAPAKPKNKFKAVPGDSVDIVVDSVEHTPEGKVICMCTIVDDHHEGRAQLNVHQIAQFATQATMLDFLDDETGNRMIFEAKVLTVNQEGVPSLTMLKSVADMADTIPQYGDEAVCVITSENVNTFMCLSGEGYSVVVPRDEHTEGYVIGDYVRVKIGDRAVGKTIRGEVMGPVADEEMFNRSAPLHNLLQAVCVDVEKVDDNDDDNLAQSQETITYEQLDELVSILRRMAFSAADYVDAYNYLGFARVLARMRGNDSMVATCSEHMDLLVLLQSFARDRRVDASEVKKHAVTAPANPMLNMLYTRLFIVSCIGRPETTSQLLDMLPAAASEEDANLLRKVISLNFMHESGDIDSVRGTVLEQIAGILNVNFHHNDLKHYGAESQSVEFKTSIVYPADNHMQPDVVLQNHEIAQIVCGFLNADGGTLYIGVKNNGIEQGVDDDMPVLKVKNMDEYTLKVENLINRLLGPTANTYVTVETDPESKRNVVAVVVKPCMHVISMLDDGAVYVRHTTSTRRMEGEHLETFKKDRAMRYKLMQERYK